MFNIYDGIKELLEKFHSDGIKLCVATSKPQIYTDKILEKWYGQGLRTKEDIEAFEKNKKDSKGDNDPQKSYEIDDFFAAALNRSLKDLK